MFTPSKKSPSFEQTDTMSQTCFPMSYRVALVGAMGLLANVGVRKSFALVMTYVTASQSTMAEEHIFTNVSTTSSLV